MSTIEVNLQKYDNQLKIIKKLEGLGVSGFELLENETIVGPIVTGYVLRLSNRTSIKKITSKSDDLALALGVPNVDIQQIGENIVIFVPNEERKIVDFKDSLFWLLKDEKVREMSLPILLGTDFRGNGAALDLATQPHVLIAGSTGSGKSVFESNIIAALAMAKSTKELDLYLVDTKQLDLTLFESIPQVKKVAKTVEDWYLLIEEITKTVISRNTRMLSVGARNINEYNSNFCGEMTHIVLIIDELADLIEKDIIVREEIKQKAREDGERPNYSNPTVSESLKRLIQICRASGVHVIACTQRTSTDIISGTIKSNFPTRISLRLPTAIDSRTILGEGGAEHLLGKGDMMIKTGDSEELKRYHGPYVRLTDIEMIMTQQDMIKESLGLER